MPVAPPESVKIGHATFTVEADAETVEAANADGLFIAGERRIAYNPGNAPDRIREILWHEVVHGCVEVSGRTDLFADDDAEEQVVHALTGPLLNVLRSNPQLLRFLRAAD